MQATHCPLCHQVLEVREVSPCMDCGHDPIELEHARSGMHTYAEYLVFGDLSLVLCDFCMVDFTSYDPTYFGLPPGARIGMGEPDWRFIRDMPMQISKDKCCTACGYRLPFLEFVEQARLLHGKPDMD